MPTFVLISGPQCMKPARNKNSAQGLISKLWSEVHSWLGVRTLHYVYYCSLEIWQSPSTCLFLNDLSVPRPCPFMLDWTSAQYSTHPFTSVFWFLVHTYTHKCPDFRITNLLVRNKKKNYDVTSRATIFRHTKGVWFTPRFVCTKNG